MTLPYNKNLKSFSRSLRTQMTNCEAKLWARLRRKQLKDRQFYRQKPVGNYIVDFYCPSARLIVELDGGQHFTDEGRTEDRIRDEFLRSLNLTVLRFSDRDVIENVEGVLQKIFDYV